MRIEEGRVSKLLHTHVDFFREREREMAAPSHFIGTIEDDEEVDNDDIDSEEEEVSTSWISDAYKAILFLDL